jgi:hypothetical protein
MSVTPTPGQLEQIARTESLIVPGRSCGTCSLCCKVPHIAEFDKPAGKWCVHCRPGNGCGIHPTRPVSCRGFYCEWMIAKGLGPEWKPERAKFLLSKTNGRDLIAQVDPGFPHAWRASPYYENFKIWAAEAARQTPLQKVLVLVGERVTVVLPDRDVEVGVVSVDELVEMHRDRSGSISVTKARRANMVAAAAAV